MTPEQLAEKALELFPIETPDYNKVARQYYIDGGKFILQSLAGDESAEEVLMDNNIHLEPLKLAQQRDGREGSYFDRIIKAMQQYRMMGVANAYLRRLEMLDNSRQQEIDGLKAELKNECSSHFKKVADCILLKNENERLKAEVERLKNEIKENDKYTL